MENTYLKATYFIDCDHPKVVRYATKITAHCNTAKAKIIALFIAVRDGYFYNPYHLDLRPQTLKASNILTRQSAYCIEKAILLCAAIRAVQLPARLHFGDVKNHIAVDRLLEKLQTNVLAFHGCTEVFLENRWIKITPAFNKSLCEKLGVPVLEFDGTNQAIFQQYSNDGTNFMEYLKEYGSYDDLPYARMLLSFKENYPHIQFPDNLILEL